MNAKAGYRTCKQARSGVTVNLDLCYPTSTMFRLQLGPAEPCQLDGVVIYTHASYINAVTKRSPRAFGSSRPLEIGRYNGRKAVMASNA